MEAKGSEKEQMKPDAQVTGNKAEDKDESDHQADETLILDPDCDPENRDDSNKKDEINDKDIVTPEKEKDRVQVKISETAADDFSERPDAKGLDDGATMNEKQTVSSIENSEGLAANIINDFVEKASQLMSPVFVEERGVKKRSDGRPSSTADIATSKSASWKDEDKEKNEGRITDNGGNLLLKEVSNNGKIDDGVARGINSEQSNTRIVPQEDRNSQSGKEDEADDLLVNKMEKVNRKVPPSGSSDVTKRSKEKDDKLGETERFALKRLGSKRSNDLTCRANCLSLSDCLIKEEGQRKNSSEFQKREVNDTLSRRSTHLCSSPSTPPLQKQKSSKQLIERETSVEQRSSRKGKNRNQSASAVRKTATLNTPIKKLQENKSFSSPITVQINLRQLNASDKMETGSEDSPIRRVKNKRGNTSVKYDSNSEKETGNGDSPVVRRLRKRQNISNASIIHSESDIDATNSPARRFLEKEGSSTLLNKSEIDGGCLPVMRLRKRKSGDAIRGLFAQYEILDTSSLPQEGLKLQTIKVAHNDELTSDTDEISVSTIRKNQCRLISNKESKAGPHPPEGKVDVQRNKCILSNTNKLKEDSECEWTNVADSSSSEPQNLAGELSTSTPLRSASKKKQASAASKRKKLKVNCNLKGKSVQSIGSKAQSNKKCSKNEPSVNESRKELATMKQQKQQKVQEIVDEFLPSPMKNNSKKEAEDNPSKPEQVAKEAIGEKQLQGSNGFTKENSLQVGQDSKVRPKSESLKKSNAGKQIADIGENPLHSQFLTQGFASSKDKEQPTNHSSETESLPPSASGLSEGKEDLKDKSFVVNAHHQEGTFLKSPRSSSLSIEPALFRNTRKRTLSGQSRNDSKKVCSPSSESCQPQYTKEMSLSSQNSCQPKHRSRKARSSSQGSVQLRNTRKKSPRERRNGSEKACSSGQESFQHSKKRSCSCEDSFQGSSGCRKMRSSNLESCDVETKENSAYTSKSETSTEVGNNGQKKVQNFSENLANETLRPNSSVLVCTPESGISPLRVVVPASNGPEDIPADKEEASDILCKSDSDPGKDEIISMAITYCLNSSAGNTINEAKYDDTVQKEIRGILTCFPEVEKDKQQNSFMEQMQGHSTKDKDVWDYELSDDSVAVGSDCKISEPELLPSPCVVSPSTEVRNKSTSNIEILEFPSLYSNGKSIQQCIGADSITSNSIPGQPMMKNNKIAASESLEENFIYVPEQPGFARTAKVVNYSAHLNLADFRSPRSSRCFQPGTPPSKAPPSPQTPRSRIDELAFDPSSDGHYEHVNTVAHIITGLPSPNMKLFGTIKNVQKSETNQKDEEESYGIKGLPSPKLKTKLKDGVHQALEDHQSGIDQSRDTECYDSKKYETVSSTSRKRSQESIVSPSDSELRSQKRSRTDTATNTEKQASDQCYHDADGFISVNDSQATSTDDVFEGYSTLEYSSLADRLKRNRRNASQKSEDVIKECLTTKRTRKKQRKRGDSTTSLNSGLSEACSSEYGFLGLGVCDSTFTEDDKHDETSKTESVMCNTKRKSKWQVSITSIHSRTVEPFVSDPVFSTPTNISNTPGSNPLFFSSCTLTSSFISSQLSQDMLDDIFPSQPIRPLKPLPPSPNFIQKVPDLKPLPNQLSPLNSASSSRKHHHSSHHSTGMHMTIPACSSSIANALHKRRKPCSDVQTPREQSLPVKSRKTDSQGNKSVYNSSYVHPPKKPDSQLKRKQLEQPSDYYDFDG